MKNIFILVALISFTIFTACNKDEMVDTAVSIDEEPTTSITTEDNVGEAHFTIDNDRKTLMESEELLLTNNSVNAVSYHWDFGNGDTSTEVNPIFNNYKMHGNYTVTLTITDALGNTHEARDEIEVLCIFGGGPHEF